MQKKWITSIRKHSARIVLVLNLLTALGLWACCISTWIHPSSYPKFALMGLAFPIFLGANLAFTLLWLCVKWKQAWIPLATILPCFGYVMDYCPISFRNEVPEGCLKIVSWNTENYGCSFENKEEGRKLTFEYLENSGADIIFLQESSIWEGVTREFSQHMDSLGYQEDRYHGNILFSKFQIIDSDTLSYETTIVYKNNRTNCSKWYKLLNGKDTILVVNNHLESNHLNLSDKEELAETIDNPGYRSLKRNGHKISSHIANSSAIRAQQADSLVNLVKRFEGMPILLCGDFNDTPISYTYQHVNSLLKSAYKESGNGIGLSFNRKGFWVRIDHLFVSQHWQTYNTHIDKSIKTSDHYPLVSWLKME